METIVRIERVAMRGGPPKIVISTEDGQRITIQPGEINTLKLIKLLAGGPQESVSLAGETK